MNFFWQTRQQPEQEQQPLSIPIPFLHQQVGSGDVVQGITNAMGAQPCTPCEERKKRMNQAVVFRPMGE